MKSELELLHVVNEALKNLLLHWYEMAESDDVKQHFLIHCIAPVLEYKKEILKRLNS